MRLTSQRLFVLDHLHREDPGGDASAGSSGERGCSAQPSSLLDVDRPPVVVVRLVRRVGRHGGGAFPEVAQARGAPHLRAGECPRRRPGRGARPRPGRSGRAGCRSPLRSAARELLVGVHRELGRRTLPDRLGVRRALARDEDRDCEPGGDRLAAIGAPGQAAPDARRFGNPNHTTTVTRGTTVGTTTMLRVVTFGAKLVAVAAFVGIFVAAFVGLAATLRVPGRGARRGQRPWDGR